MKTFALIAGLTIALLTTAPQAAAAQSMTVQTFLTTAAGIPRNPTALLRSDTRRLIGEIRTGIAAVRRERETAIAAGQTPTFCPPAGKISIGADDLLARLNSIPASRRNITVRQAMREWMADRYPCAS